MRRAALLPPSQRENSGNQLPHAETVDLSRENQNDEDARRASSGAESEIDRMIPTKLERGDISCAAATSGRSAAATS
jgi:hypothetical protein